MGTPATFDRSGRAPRPVQSPAPAQPVATARPVAEAARIVPIDILRGVAILGILLMNIQSFAMPGDAYLNPAAYGDLTGVNRWVWIVCHIAADQKFISIFSMLFGAGILLMAGRAGPRAAALHYRRMAILIVFGLLHAHLLWSGDVLYTYGVCGLVVYLARRLRAPSLLVLGLAVHAVASIIFLHYGFAMRHWPANAIDAVRSDFWQSPPAAQASEIAAFRGGWLRQMPQRSDDAVAMETFLFVIDSVWKAGGLMLIGMGLYKLDVLTGRRSGRFYRRLLATSLAVGLPLVAYGVWSNFRAHWDVRYSLFFGSQFNYWGSIPLALAWVAAVMLLYQSRAWVGLQRRLAAVGRTALSNYIFQTVVCTTLFYGHGLGLFGRVSRAGQLAIVVAVWIVQLTLAPAWLARFRFGPLEWLWRSLTYGRAQPMRGTKDDG